MVIEPKIKYYESGKIEREYWYINGLYHRVDGPAIIWYYESGKIKEEHWYLNDKLHRVDGPAYLRYYESGKIEEEIWYLNDKELKNKELIEYKAWLIANNLYKPYNTWSDEEKVLWRLSWI